jgi:hypothetical protein
MAIFLNNDNEGHTKHEHPRLVGHRLCQVSAIQGSRNNHAVTLVFKTTDGNNTSLLVVNGTQKKTRHRHVATFIFQISWH